MRKSKKDRLRKKAKVDLRQRLLTSFVLATVAVGFGQTAAGKSLVGFSFFVLIDVIKAIGDTVSVFYQVFKLWLTFVPILAALIFMFWNRDENWMDF